MPTTISLRVTFEEAHEVGECLAIAGVGATNEFRIGHSVTLPVCSQ